MNFVYLFKKQQWSYFIFNIPLHNISSCFTQKERLLITSKPFTLMKGHRITENSENKALNRTCETMRDVLTKQMQKVTIHSFIQYEGLHNLGTQMTLWGDKTIVCRVQKLGFCTTNWVFKVTLKSEMQLSQNKLLFIGLLKTEHIRIIPFNDIQILKYSA